MWPKLNKENYLSLNNRKDNFYVNKGIRSILRWGRGSEKGKEITFFIPAYKRADLLQEAVQSILQQGKILDYEIIIIDNSGDFSESNPIYQYVKKLDNPDISFYVNEKNIGMTGNWNRGFEVARNNNIAMLHDDDLLGENYLFQVKKAIEYLKREDDNYGFIRINSLDFHESSHLPKLPIKSSYTLLKESLVKSLFVGIGPTSCPTCGMLFSRKAVLDVGGWDDRFYPATDYILGYQLMKYGYNGYTIKEPLAYYRIGANESTKHDIHIGFVMADYFFREYMYSRSFFTKIFGYLFRNVQYTNSVDGLYKNAKRFGVSITKEELNFTRGYGRYPFRKFIFRCLRKVYKFYFNKQIYKMRG